MPGVWTVSLPAFLASALEPLLSSRGTLPRPYQRERSPSPDTPSETESRHGRSGSHVLLRKGEWRSRLTPGSSRDPEARLAGAPQRGPSSLRMQLYLLISPPPWISSQSSSTGLRLQARTSHFVLVKLTLLDLNPLPLHFLIIVHAQ